MKILKSLIVFAGLVCAATSLAWDGDGHTTIGIIAYDQLSASERQKLVTIFQRGDFEFRIDPASEAFTVGKTATWADYIKGNRDSGFEKEIQYWNDWAFPVAQQGSNNEATRCRCWHYKNIVIHTEGRQNRVQHAPFDAVKAVRLAQSRFKTESTDRMKAFWLYWLMHLVGDLHQPLHCVSSVKYDPTGDAGGNKFALTGQARNLHFLWDNGISDALVAQGWRGGLVEKAGLVQKMHPSSSFGNLIKQLDPDAWCQEGADHAVKTVYVGIKPNDSPSAEYEKRRKDLSLKQAALGGYRLAEVLKALL
ncbi:S1/P1 nuclease [Geitlerinema splendidum]|nr:S1/P1 nuclease [Geitlerinema splendidum]